MKPNTLKILNSTLSLKAEELTYIRKMLKKVQFIRANKREWVDVHCKGSLMSAEFEEWEKNREDKK